MNWFSDMFRSTASRLHDTVDSLSSIIHKQQDTIQQQATVIASPQVQTAVNASAPVQVATQWTAAPAAPPVATAPNPYPKTIHDPDGGTFVANNPAEEAQHAIDVARTQAINAQNAGPTLPGYSVSAVIPVPAPDDVYVVWGVKQNPKNDLIGAVNFFNAQPDEHGKWMFGTMRGSELLTNWIGLHFIPQTVSPYINKYELMQPSVGNPHNPFFPV